MKILFLGEVVGRPGYSVIKQGLKSLGDFDLVIANGEGMFNGYGINVSNAINLLKCGVDIITGGEKLFYKREMYDFIKDTNKVLRPYNHPSPDVNGKGVRWQKIKDKNVAVINIIGNMNMRFGYSNALSSAKYAVDKAKETSSHIIVIFHSSASAEKRNMLYLLDGKVSAVLGTHTKVITADEYITEKGTAYITDNGRCGSFLSVGGFNPEEEIKKLKSNIVVKSKECFDCPEIQGVMVELDEDGKAVDIKRIREKVNISNI